MDIIALWKMNYWMDMINHTAFYHDKSLCDTDLWAAEEKYFVNSFWQ